MNGRRADPHAPENIFFHSLRYNSKPPKMKLYYKKPWLIFFIYLRPKVLPTPGHTFRPVSPKIQQQEKQIVVTCALAGSYTDL
jgi:hypothetical protein